VCVGWSSAASAAASQTKKTASIETCAASRRGFRGARFTARSPGSAPLLGPSMLLASVSAAVAFHGTPLHTSRVRPAVMSVEIGAAATAWQTAALERVASTLKLEAKLYAADLGFDSFSLSCGTTGSVASYELSGKESNVAWCSGLLTTGPVCRGSVTAWCGPLTDVPHLTAASGVSAGGVDLLIDFKVRAECAYLPSGEYEEPASREAFAQGSNRKDFAEAFFTDEVNQHARSGCPPNAYETFSVASAPQTRPSLLRAY